jgi:hypothetical protein
MRPSSRLDVFSRLMPPTPPKPPVDPHRAAALSVVNAGRRARNLPPLEDEPNDQPPPPPLDQPPPPLDPHAVARFIVLAGKRRRGEIE